MPDGLFKVQGIMNDQQCMDIKVGDGFMVS